MTEAVYNASGLGLPIVMTIANRAIGAPINIWNDHSDAMTPARRRLDPALRRDQPGSGRPAHPGLQAGRGAVAPGDGVHGRLHPHPRHRARRPARPRSRSTPSCRRTSRGSCSTRTTRCPSAPWSGPEAFTEVRYLAYASRCRRSTSSRPSRPTSRARSAATPAASSSCTARDDADRRGRARLGARHDQGRDRRAARRRRAGRRARHHHVPPVPAQAVRDALGDDDAAAPGRARAIARARAPAASSRPDGASDRDGDPGTRSSDGHRRPRRPARHPGSLRGVLTSAARGELPAQLPRPGHATWSRAS